MGRNAKALGRSKTRKRQDPPRAGEKQASGDEAERGLGEVRSAALEPIGVVERELTRPDGTTVVVEVPVYPPFRLSDQPGGGRKAPPRARSAPSLKRKRSSKLGAGER